MNRTEVLERVSPISDLKLKVIDGDRVKVGMTDEAIVLRPGTGGKLIPFAPEGVESLGKFSGFPAMTTKRLSNQTASNVMTELLRRKEKFSVFTKDGEIVSVFKAQQWHTLKIEKMLTVLENVIHLQDYNRVLPLETQKHGVRIEMVGERREVVAGSALKNDVIAGGIVVEVSPIGTFAPTVESFVLRVWCTNGCYTPEITSQYEYPTGGDGDEIFQWFRATSRKAYNSVAKIAKHFEQMAGENISPEDRASILDAMLMKAHISGEAAAAVRAEALAHPPRDTWDMMNLITWGASHILTDTKEVVRAHKSVREFITASTHQRTCPMCHQAQGHSTVLESHGNPSDN